MNGPQPCPPVNTARLFPSVVGFLVCAPLLVALAGCPTIQSCPTCEMRNHDPELAPLAATKDGRWIRMAEPGEVVLVRANAHDEDGDRLRYRWIATPGSGSVRLVTSSVVEWQVGVGDPDNRLSVVVADGKGGYAKGTLRLPTRSEVVFGGQVLGPDGEPIASASVEANGETTTTDAEGFFKLPIDAANAPTFVVNIRKFGFGMISRVYDQSVHDGKWTMLPGTVRTVDPTQAIMVTDVSSQANCTGALTSGIDWHNYPQQSVPQVIDTFGELSSGTIPTEITETLAFIFGGTACSPGISINIPANTLVDADGNPPAGSVDVALTTVDLYAPDSMPGDFSVQTKEGTRWMQSYGAGGVNVQASGIRYQLKPGHTAELTLPVDPNQLMRPQRRSETRQTVRRRPKLPKVIPLLLYDEGAGRWTIRGDAQLAQNGRSYVATINHFSEFNTDLIKTDQACLRFSGDSLVSTIGTAGEFDLDAIIPMGAAAPVVRNWDVSPSTDPLHAADPNLHVIVNLPSNTWITLVPMRDEAGMLIPYGIFSANSGSPQTPTDPNFPVHPYDACANEIVLTDIGGAIDIVVDGTGHAFGPLPIHTFALTNPAGTDIYPLAPTIGALALYSLYDTGTTKVRINDLVPKRIGGNIGNTDAEFLNLTGLADVNVRLNGLNAQDTADCSVPIDSPGTPFGAQVEVTGIATRPYTLDATLIGASVFNQVVAHIDYQQSIPIPACAGLFIPISGPYMDFYLPGDPGIPNPDLNLTLERFGNLVSTDGATVGQRYWLRNVIFQEGTNVVADDPNAADPFDFLFDTGTTPTIVNDRLATTLGLNAGAGTFDCSSGTNNGYVIDSFTAIGVDGTYRVTSANICWDESSISQPTIIDAVIGSNLFDQVQIIVDGPGDQLGIIE